MFVARTSARWDRIPSGWALLSTPTAGYRLGALVVCLGAGILAATYSLVTPLWEAPDTLGHYQYILRLATGHGLPVQRIGELGEAHQPPLYYFIASLAVSPSDLANPAGGFKPNPNFVWAGQGGSEVNIGLHTADETFPYTGQARAIHIARAVSVLMGILTVAITLSIGWEIFPERPLIGLFAAALVGLTPQFLFISGSLNNDNLLVLCSTGAYWQLVRALKRPEQRRRWVYVGVWSAAACLAKISGPVVAATAGFVLLACALHRRSSGLFFQGALAMGLPILLLAGWWFGRSHLLYGDPLGWAEYWRVYGVDLRQTPFRLRDMPDFFSVQLRSFWGLFGWMNVAPPSWFYVPPLVLGCLGLAGLGQFARRGGFHRLAGSQQAAITLLGAAAVIQEVFLMTLILRCNPSCYQGRYLFPVIGPLMLLLSLGLLTLVPARAANVLVGCVLLVLVAGALFAPFGVIQLAYQMGASPGTAL